MSKQYVVLFVGCVREVAEVSLQPNKTVKMDILASASARFVPVCVRTAPSRNVGVTGAYSLSALSELLNVSYQTPDWLFAGSFTLH
jgi:hypothetical protein